MLDDLLRIDAEHTPPTESIVENAEHTARVRRRPDGQLAIRISRSPKGYAWMVISSAEADALITCLIEQTR